MNQRFVVAHILLFVLMLQPCFSQTTQKPVYVIVHGAWGGGWAFKKVDSLLTAKGCIVYRPTLTGQGERIHLATPETGLKTHINDVVNTILFEDLYDVILVGHSYGGMVVTGVADSLPGRISRIVYIDAFVPEDGESVWKILEPRTTGLLSPQGLKKIESNGFLVPGWVPANAAPPKDVPEPLKAFTEPIRLKNTSRARIPATYIFTVGKGKQEKEDDFFAMAERAGKKGWPVWKMVADHNPQWSEPTALSALLLKVGGK